jgi:hypothetical protein
VNAADLENEFLDLHGREVHALSMEIANIGFNRMADPLVSMLGSEACRSFQDGVGSYAFLRVRTCARRPMATDDSEWWGAKWGAIVHQHQATLRPFKRSIYLCDLACRHGQQLPATA